MVGRVAYAARNRRGTFVLPPVILSKRGLRPRASKDLLLRPVRLRGSRSSRRSAQGDKGASRRAGRQKDECPLPSFVPNDTFPQGGRQVCGGGCASRMRRAGMGGAEGRNRHRHGEAARTAGFSLPHGKSQPPSRRDFREPSGVKTPDVRAADSRSLPLPQSRGAESGRG